MPATGEHAGRRDANIRRVHLDYAGRTICAASSDPADIEWLLEFVQPDFQVDNRNRESTGARGPEVVLRRNDGEFERLHALGPDVSGGAVATFALDGRMEALPRWRSPDSPDGLGGSEVVFVEQGGAFMSRHPATGSTHGRVEILARSGRPSARVALLRAVREIATAGGWAGLKGPPAQRGQGPLPQQPSGAGDSGRSGVVLHAAAGAVNGRGVVLAGPKGAGKTTLLLHLLSRAVAATRDASGRGGVEVQLVANDRATLSRDGNAIRLRGMPTIVSVRESSLAFLPQLADAFRACRDHHRFTVREGAGRAGGAGGAGRAGGAGGWSLSPAQLAELVGVGRSGEVPLAAILFPRLTGNAGGLNMTRLVADDAMERIGSVVFRADPAAGPGSVPVGKFFLDFLREGFRESYGSLFDEPEAARRAEGETALLRDAAAAIPCFDCALGTDGYTDASARQLIDLVDRV